MRIAEINEAAFCLPGKTLSSNTEVQIGAIMSQLRILTIVLMLFFTASNFSVVGNKLLDQRCYCYDMNPRHKVPIFLGIYYVDLKFFWRSNDSSIWSTDESPLWRLRPKYSTVNLLHSKSY